MFMPKKKFDVIIPINHPTPPDKYEQQAAWILAEYYNAVVEFLIPINSYKRTTVDAVINGQLWEIKTPDGKSKKNTIRDQFTRANYQKADYLAINSGQTKLTDAFVKSEIVRLMKIHRRIKKVALITKEQKVLEFER
jgi:hypothetical protein